MDYTVTLVAGLSPSVVDNVKQASTTGTSSAATFADILKIYLNTEIARSPELQAMGVEATVVAVTAFAQEETTTEQTGVTAAGKKQTSGASGAKQLMVVSVVLVPVVVVAATNIAFTHLFLHMVV